MSPVLPGSGPLAACAGLLRRVSLAADRAARWLLAAIGLSMASVIALQVFFRYALNDSLFWSEGLGRTLLVWLTFVGASVAYRRGAHIGVDFFTGLLPAAPRRAVRLFATVACLAFFWLLARYGWDFMRLSAFQTMPALGVSRAWAVAAIPLGGAIMCLHALADLAGQIAGTHSASSHDHETGGNAA